MTESITEKINQTLSWRRILGFNFVLMLVLILPLSVQLSQQSAENRSSAASQDVVSTPPPPPAKYPVESPRIDRVTMFFGKPGDSIVILGSNFGDYQWGSEVTIGGVKATNNEVGKWSNGVIEVQIPSGSRSGRVGVLVNGKRTEWEGSLLLYNKESATKIGLRAENSTQAWIWLEKAAQVKRGIIELSYVSEPLTISGVGQATIGNQSYRVDSLGKKVVIEFTVEGDLPRTMTTVAQVGHPAIGALEILRVELYDAAGRMVDVYADPLSVKLLP